MYDQIERMQGKKLKKVELNPDKTKITFEFLDGYTTNFGVEGDCCSHSWIEHIETFVNQEGATFLSIEEDVMDKTEDDEYNPKVNNSKHESLQVYSTRFKFDRGEIVLEYRNSSNGYYGGYLVTL